MYGKNVEIYNNNFLGLSFTGCITEHNNVIERNATLLAFG